MKMSVNKRVNCQKCKHFYVTWDKRYPRGCKAYGIKTRYIPSVIVFKSTGIRCVCYQQKKSY